MTLQVTLLCEQAWFVIVSEIGNKMVNLTKNAHGQQVLFAYDTTKHDLLRDLG